MLRNDILNLKIFIIYLTYNYPPCHLICAGSDLFSAVIDLLAYKYGRKPKTKGNYVSAEQGGFNLISSLF